ncbi:MAG: hypothetical protein PHP98_11210 [Kiritimatiellae bacterium]|nr:hypothetical protein [Kiritimatiellia bacterium]
MLAKGVSPRLYYLRTKGGLEVDLLIEGRAGVLHPFEFKLTRTPRREMGDAIARFRSEFGKLNPAPGGLVTLSDHDAPLTRDARLMPLSVFLSKAGILSLT